MTLFSHSSSVKNKLASIVYFGTLEVSMTLGGLHKASATILLLFGFVYYYEIMLQK
jgi:hypothetical protein